MAMIKASIRGAGIAKIPRVLLTSRQMRHITLIRKRNRSRYGKLQDQSVGVVRTLVTQPAILKDRMVPAVASTGKIRYGNGSRRP